MGLRQGDGSSSDSESVVGLMVRQALSACNDRTNSWIVDSGATCHMCNSGVVMSDFHSLKKPQEVTLGDGHVLEATGRGTVDFTCV